MNKFIRTQKKPSKIIKHTETDLMIQQTEDRNIQ